MTTPITIDLEVNVPAAVALEISTPSVDIAPDTDGAPVLLVAVPGAPGPQGPPGEGTRVIGETPGGAMNGTNLAFTTANPYRAATTAVYLNGLRETSYTESGSSTITFADPPLSTDMLSVDYIIE